MFPRKLQLREARHQSHTLRLEDGTVISEPPGVEGYITRVERRGKSSRAELYITTHDGESSKCCSNTCIDLGLMPSLGHIIISKPNSAQPPIKPGPEGSTPLDLFHDVYDEFHESELARLTSIIESSDGIIDFRSIESIKMFEPSAHSQASDATAAQDGQATSSPATDAPPAEAAAALPTHENKRQRRILVALERDGEITLEARSRSIAQEWVQRLSGLAEYWKRRQRVDARIRMDVVKMHSPHKAMTSELSNDSDALLSDVWNWCVVQGCRTVTLSGRLFMKKGGMEKFRAKYLVLAGGGLVTFKIKSKLAYSARKRHYTLFGAYVSAPHHNSSLESGHRAKRRADPCLGLFWHVGPGRAPRSQPRDDQRWTSSRVPRRSADFRRGGGYDICRSVGVPPNHHLDQGYGSVED